VKRVLILVLGIVMGAAGSSMITGARSASAGTRSQAPSQTTNAAYHDGLFLGGLDAKQGRTPHICRGRWSSASDRDAFTAGYEAGYSRF
jgi:hypothetical protein